MISLRVGIPDRGHTAADIWTEMSVSFTQQVMVSRR